jgi:CHAT domain-containing protein/thioredoxin-like negative regulator of GroEL
MNDPGSSPASERGCVTSDELYQYLTEPAALKHKARLEKHLTECASCRQELAELLQLLYPASGEAVEEFPEPDQQEIERTVNLVRTANRTSKAVQRNRWVSWFGAAAAALLLVIIGGLGYQVLFEKRRSAQFFAEGKQNLEQVYSGTSPGRLRLDLPFRVSAEKRDHAEEEILQRAETLFVRALALQDDMLEAHLGLASVYLSGSRLSDADRHFQRALDIRKDDFRALLGRAVVRHERARQSRDPVGRMNMLNKALDDLNAVLQSNPGSAEARYDSAWILYETGRHKEALAQIETYLSRDPDSLWAARLRDLRTRIRLTKAENFQEEVQRAAAARNASALERLTALAPFHAPAAIRLFLRRSSAAQLSSEAARRAEAADLYWAAQVIAKSHAAVARDATYEKLLGFYAGLSPPQRARKKALDQRLEALVELHLQGRLLSALRGTESLIPQYEALRDYWQLSSIRHLRGNCIYFGTADFESAMHEYRIMLDLSERGSDPDLIARALGALSVGYLDRGRYQEALTHSSRLIDLADRCSLDVWKAFGHRTLANAYLALNSYDDSLRHYVVALTLANRLMDTDVLIDGLHSTGRLLTRMNRLPEADAIYDEARRQLDRTIGQGSFEAKVTLRVRQLNLLGEQAELAYQRGNLSRAEQLLTEGLAEASVAREVEIRLTLGLAQVHLAQRRIEPAEAAVDRALALIGSREYPNVHWRAHLLKGKLRRHSGDLHAAVENFRSAIERLESIRARTGDLRQSFFIDRFEPYKEMVALLSGALNRQSQALAYVQRAKSMALREQLVHSGTAIDPCSAIQGAKIVEYFVTDDRLFVFTDCGAGARAASVEVAAEDLKRQITAFLESIQENDTVAFRRLSRKLYDELWSPVQELLKTPETVVVLPDGPLHLLPFAALQNREGRYLIEMNALTYSPSRAVLQHCLALDRGRIDNARRSVLLMDGSENLSAARDELAYIAKVYRDVRFFEPVELGSLEKLAASAEILHFAGHSTIVDGNPRLIFQAAGSNAFLDAQRISRWRLRNNRLVNLAGCSTGSGPQAEGESPWGLVPALFRAGAPAVLFSLLPVDDRSTQRMSSRFYELISGSAISKAQALQQAQLSILHSTGSKLSDWIPYALSGDPR